MVKAQGYLWTPVSMSFTGVEQSMILYLRESWPLCTLWTQYLRALWGNTRSRHAEAHGSYLSDAISRFRVFLIPSRFCRRRRSEGFS
jgi:hypothetical protein